MKKLMNRKVLTIFALLSLGTKAVMADIVAPINKPFDTPKYYEEERNSSLAIVIGAILIVIAISGLLIISFNIYKKKDNDNVEVAKAETAQESTQVPAEGNDLKEKTEQ